MRSRNKTPLCLCSCLGGGSVSFSSGFLGRLLLVTLLGLLIGRLSQNFLEKKIKFRTFFKNLPKFLHLRPSSQIRIVRRQTADQWFEVGHLASTGWWTWIEQRFRLLFQTRKNVNFYIYDSFITQNYVSWFIFDSEFSGTRFLLRMKFSRSSV